MSSGTMNTGKEHGVRLQAYLAAVGQTLEGGDSRLRGLIQLRDLALTGYEPAIFALAEELVRDPHPAVPESAVDWALVAFRARHYAPFDRLLARAELAGADVTTLRQKRESAAVADPQHGLRLGLLSDFLTAIGMVEAGGQHRDFGLERLRKMAAQGDVSAGLAYAEELVRDAPKRQKSARGGWAVSAAELGHHAPMLRLIAMMAQDGRTDRVDTLRQQHAAILDRLTAEEAPDATPEQEATVPDPDPAPVSAPEPVSETAPETPRPKKAPEPHPVSQPPPPPSSASRGGEAGRQGHSPYWPLHVVLVLVVIFLPALLISPALRDRLWAMLPEMPGSVDGEPAEVSIKGSSAPSKRAGSVAKPQQARATSTPMYDGGVAVSAAAKAYLEGQMQAAEARADALLKTGKEEDAESAVVEAIESAMVLGDLDALERLLDRQTQAREAVVQAIADDKATAVSLKNLAQTISRGFDFSVPPREGYWDREYIHYRAPDMNRQYPDLSCTLRVRTADKRGHPERIFKDMYLTDREVTLDLVALYNAPVRSISGTASFHEFTGRCPDAALYHQQVLIGFCKGGDKAFKDTLGEYLRRADCLP